MASITQVKPDMALLGKGGLPLSPFGLLSQAFAEEIYSHAGGTEGFYDPYDLTFLEEDGEEAPQAVPAPLVQLHVDLKLILQQMKERGQGKAAERIVEKILAIKRIHERSTGRQTPQSQRAADSAPQRYFALGAQEQKHSRPQPYGQGERRFGTAGAFAQQTANYGRTPVSGTASRGASFQGAPVGAASYRRMPDGSLSFRNAVTGAETYRGASAAAMPFERTIAGAETFRKASTMAESYGRATAGVEPLGGMEREPELFRGMPARAVLLGKRFGKTAPFQQLPALEMLSGRTSYEEKALRAFRTKAANKQAFSFGNAGPHGVETGPAYAGMGKDLSYVPYTAYTAGFRPETGIQRFPFPEFAEDILPMEDPHRARATRQTGGGFLPHTEKLDGYSAAAEAMAAFPNEELVFYQESDRDASFGYPMASTGKVGFPALNLPPLASFLLKSFPSLPRIPQDLETEGAEKARPSQSRGITRTAVRDPSKQIQEPDTFLPFAQDIFSETGRQFTPLLHPAQTIRPIPSGGAAQAGARRHNRAGTAPGQAGGFHQGPFPALPYKVPTGNAAERAAGFGVSANPAMPVGRASGDRFDAFPVNSELPRLPMGWGATPEALQLEYAQEPAALPVQEVPFQPGTEAAAKKFGSAAAREMAASWKAAVAGIRQFSANYLHPGALRSKPGAYPTATRRAGSAIDRPDAKRQDEATVYRQGTQPTGRLPLGQDTPPLGAAASGWRIPSGGSHASLAARQSGLAAAAMPMLTAPGLTTAADMAGKTGAAGMGRKQASPSKGFAARPVNSSNNLQEFPVTRAGSSQGGQLPPFQSEHAVDGLPGQGAAAFLPLDLEHVQEAGAPLAGQAALTMERSGLPALERISRQLDSAAHKETAVLPKAGRPENAASSWPEPSAQHPERSEFPDAKRHLIIEGTRPFPDGKPRDPGKLPLAASGMSITKADGTTIQPGMEPNRDIPVGYGKGLLPPPLPLEHVGEPAEPEAVQPGRAVTDRSYERLKKRLEALDRQMAREPGRTAAAPQGKQRQTGMSGQPFTSASSTAPVRGQRQAGMTGKPFASTASTAPVRGWQQTGTTGKPFVSTFSTASVRGRQQTGTARQSFAGPSPTVPVREQRQAGTIGQPFVGIPSTAPLGEQQIGMAGQPPADTFLAVRPGEQQTGTMEQSLAGGSSAAEPTEGKPSAIPEKTPPVLQNLLEKAAQRWAATEAGPFSPMALPPVELDYSTEAGLTESAPLPRSSAPVRRERSASPHRVTPQPAAARPGSAYAANVPPSISRQGDARQTLPNPMRSPRTSPAQGSAQTPISHPMLSHRTASRQASLPSGTMDPAFPRQLGAREGAAQPADMWIPQLSHRMTLSPVPPPPFGGKDTGGRSPAGAYAGYQQEAYPALQMAYSTPFAALARDLRQAAVGMHQTSAAEAMAAKAEPEPMQALAQVPPPQIENQIVWQNPYMRSGPAETAYRQKPSAARQAQPQPQARISDAEIRRTADKVFKMVQEKIIAERRRIGRF